MNTHKSNRQSNFELLRIFAIFLVIYTHYCLFYGGLSMAQGSGISDFLVQMLFVISKSCVDLFLILSGYFMVKADIGRIKWGKVLTLLIMTVFYCSIINNYNLYARGSLTIPDIVRSLIPSSYYINIYCALYMLSPFINKAFEFGKNTRLRFVLLAFLIFSAWPDAINLLGWKYSYSFVGCYPTSYLDEGGGLTLINFTLCYIIGAYLRTNNLLSKVAMRWRIIAVLVISGTFAAIGVKMPGLVSTDAFTGYSSVVTIVQSALIFSIFADIRIMYNKCINLASKATLVVYLTNELTLYILFYQYDLNAILPQAGIWGFVSGVACCIAVWGVGVIIYYVMTWIFAPLISWWKRTRLYNQPIYPQN